VSAYVTVQCLSICLSVPSIESSSDTQLVCHSLGSGGRYQSIAVGAMYQLVTDVCRCQHHVESQGMIHASDLAPWLTITGNINAFIVLYCMKLNTDLLLLYPHITTTDHYQPPQLKINYLFVHECITGPLNKHFPHYHYQY